MTVRRLAVAAVAALATIPFASVMAGSGTTGLPNALANPLESSFVEVTSSTSDELVGYFDAEGFANWAGNNAGSRDSVRSELVSNGFVTGYQRIWFMDRSKDSLYETVFVFKSADGANSMLSTEKEYRSEATTFKAWVPLQLNDSAFALQETGTSYYWISAGFSKGNDAFMLFRGSETDFATSAGLAQAREMYSLAPNGTSLSSQPAGSHQSALSRYLTPLVVVFVIGAVLLTVALVIAVIVTVIPRERPSPPVAVQPRP